MIDTDKYEGHTGPWLLIDGDIYKGGPKETHKRANMIADTAFGGYESIKARHADRWLMADAPLLLEEVKRLRRAFRIATAHIGFGNHLGHDELRRALNSMGIDYNSLPWADKEWKEPLPTFGGVAHYD